MGRLYIHYGVGFLPFWVKAAVATDSEGENGS